MSFCLRACLSLAFSGAGGLGGAPDVDHRGPRGAQVPDRGGELALPAGDGLAGAAAAARVMVDVLPAGTAVSKRESRS